MPTTCDAGDDRQRRPHATFTLARDAAASPVVGFVLVLGISLTAMTLVFLWGAPTLDAVQSSQSAAAAEAEFNSLSREVETMLSGAPAQTTPTWDPTVTRGTIHLDNGMVWAVGVNDGPDLVFEWGELTDGDNEFVFKHTNPSSASADVTVNAVTYDGSDPTTLYASIGSGACDQPATVPHDTVIRVNLSKDSACGTDQPLVNGSFAIELTVDGGTGAATVAVLDAGVVRWDHNTAEEHYVQQYTNGAVLAGQGDAVAITKPPVVPPPVQEGTTTQSWFVRLLRVNQVGAAGSAGEGTNTYLLRNNGTYLRASVDHAVDLHVHPPIAQHQVWTDFFTDTSGDYVCRPAGSPVPYFTVAPAVGGAMNYVKAETSGTCLSGAALDVAVAFSTIDMQLGAGS